MFAFGEHFGIPLERHYVLEIGEASVRSANERILADVERMVPTIPDRLTFTDLESIEAAEFGARRIAERMYGKRYIEVVHIDDRTLHQL